VATSSVVANTGKLVRSIRAFAREFSRSKVLENGGPARRPRIGLALGGGFARGLSHVGVLKVIEENHVPIDFVAGTSVGAVVGAGWCSGLSAKELEEIAHLVRFKDIARWTISRLGFASNDRMTSFLERFLKCKTFEELRIPLAVAATEFSTGDGMVFRSGQLIDPVRASCAYPGMFLPVEIEGKLLVDGLLAHTVPTVPLREMGAERVMAVYLSAHWASPEGPRHVFDVIGQCFSIAQAKMCGPWQSAADLVITPDVRGVSYDGFDHARELIAEGERAAREALPTLLRWAEQPAFAAPGAAGAGSIVPGGAPPTAEPAM
jgi:NTE family protein